MVEWGQKAKPIGRAHVIGVALIAVLLFGGYQVQKHREGSPAPRGDAVIVYSPSSPETQLATLQLGTRPDHANSTVKRFSALLDIFTADCPADTRRGLAGLTVRSVAQLRHDRIPVTPTKVMGGVLGFPDIGRTDSCAQFFERYVTLRKKQGR